MNDPAARTDRPEDDLRDLLTDGNGDGLFRLFDSMPRGEALRELLHLSAGDRGVVLSLIPAELAAKLIEDVPADLAADFVERLDAGKAADIIEELGSDVQADVIGEMDDEEAEEILSKMGAEDAADVRRLVVYDGDTAGGLMVAEAFAFRDTQTVGAVLRNLASDDEDLERYRGQHPYVINEAGHPVGVLSLRGLLTSRRGAKLTEIMAPPITVPVSMSLDALEGLLDENPFLGLPVVETNGQLVGVVLRAAVDAAFLDRAESESLRRQGVVVDEFRTMPLLLRSRRRLAWLSANIVLNVIAASVISAYEETLVAVIAIAVFLPMVSDMSGCSGNQAVAVTMRELSLGLVRPAGAFRVWIKEVSVGAINGVALGLFIGLVAWFWKGNAVLGIVIGTALALNTLIAVSIGGVIP